MNSSTLQIVSFDWLIAEDNNNGFVYFLYNI